MTLIFKKPWIYPSIISGIFAGFWADAAWLPGYFPPSSARIIAGSLAVMAVMAAATYLAITLLIIPRLQPISRKDRNWFIAISLIFGLMLFGSTVDFDKLRASTIYYFLDEQALEIRPVAGIDPGRQGVTLQGFKTSVGEVSYNQVSADGWSREGDRLMLKDSHNNLLSWHGRTGKQAALVFETSLAGGVVDVAWNGIHETYNLHSPENGELKVIREFRVPFLAGWIPIAFIEAGGFCFWFGVFFLLLTGLRLKRTPVSAKPFDWLIYALPMALVWGLFLLVFFPGFMSADSVTQWREMTTGKYVDWQPPFHSMTIWLLTRLWHSPAVIGTVQIAFMACVMGWGLAIIRRLGTPAWLVWLTAVLLTLSPANAAYSITLWKDIPFAIAVTALTVMLLQIVMTRGEWLNKLFHVCLLGLTLTLVSLYRQNGILAAAGLFPFLFTAYMSFWKKIALSLVIFLSLFGMVKEVVFSLVDIAPNNMARTELATYNLLAGHLDNGTTLSGEEKAVITSAVPEGLVPYNCFRNTAMTSRVDRSYLVENKADLFALAGNLTLRNPAVTLEHFLCNGAFTFRMFEYLGYYETVWLTISQNKYGIREASLIPGIKRWLTRLVKDSADQNGMNWFFWRSPFWMFLWGVGLASSIYKNKDWRCALVIFPALLAILPLPLLSLGQIFCYVYSMYLCGVLLGGFFLFLGATEQDEPSTAETGQ